MFSLFLYQKSIIIVYNSGSQPGIRVPLGVRAELTGGTQNNFDERKKLILWKKQSYLNESESKTAIFKNFIKRQKRKINIKKFN